MRRLWIILALLLAPALVGCSIADWMFAAFGGAYSGGDSSSMADRERDFDSRVRASQAAAQYGTEP